MKSFDLKYGSSKIKVSVTGEDILGVLSGRHMEPIPSPSDAVWAALQEPVDKPPLSRVVKKGERVAVVVSDYTRATKADVFLPILINNLSEIGIPDKDIFIVFANGTHPLHTREKQEKIVGKEIASRIKLDLSRGYFKRYAGKSK